MATYTPGNTYILQIRTTSGWRDERSLTTEPEFKGAVIRAKCSKGAGNRPGAYRVVDTAGNVVADYTQDFS